MVTPELVIKKKKKKESECTNGYLFDCYLVMYLSMQINSKSLNALRGLTIYSPCQRSVPWLCGGGAARCGDTATDRGQPCSPPALGSRTTQGTWEQGSNSPGLSVAGKKKVLRCCCVTISALQGCAVAAAGSAARVRRALGQLHPPMRSGTFNGVVDRSSAPFVPHRVCPRVHTQPGADNHTLPPPQNRVT